MISSPFLARACPESIEGKGERGMVVRRRRISTLLGLADMCAAVVAPVMWVFVTAYSFGSRATVKGVCDKSKRVCE